MHHTTPPPTSQKRVPVVLSTTSLLSFISVRKAAALCIAELGMAAFFVVGVARAGIGESAPWFVLGACVLGALTRAIDIESWAFFIPGGLAGRSEKAFGPRTARFARAASLTERLLLAALACVVAVHYAVSIGVAWITHWSVTAHLTVQDLVSGVSILLLGLLWAYARFGMDLGTSAFARAVWTGIAVLVAIVALGFVTVLRGPGLAFVFAHTLRTVSSGTSLAAVAWQSLAGLALVLPMIGGGEAVARAANEFAPPRLRSLRLTGLAVGLFGLAVAVPLSFYFVALVPNTHEPPLTVTPLSDLVQHLALVPWLRELLAILLAVAAALMLVPVAHAAIKDAEQLLRRHASRRGIFAESARRRMWLRTAGGPVNLVAAAAALVIVVSGAHVGWLARAYGVAVATTLLLKISALARLRAMWRESQPFRVPLNFRLGRHEFPLIFAVVGLPVASSALVLILSGDLPSLCALAMMVGIAVAQSLASNDARAPASYEEGPELLPSAISLGQVEVRPGNVLVAVRHPDSLAHVGGALRVAGDRDVVVMTVRLLGIDVDDDATSDAASTRRERYLFSQVVALTERHGRPVQLLIVPARNVFDAVIATALRLRSSEVYVGESSTLSADDQARILGDAWERAEKPETRQVRLVIYRHSGRTDSYYLGAHPPSLTPDDLELIHRVWLDAVRAVGPHAHHHDVVRAALTQMEEQLKGPQREDALALIRKAARPSDELAAAVHEGNYPRLRELVRHRHAGDLAAVLTELGLEDQVVVFRILPRKDAAAVFEYLSRESQEALLKGMAEEEVAALLNNMAPDDRTMFLEELPAAATRQLLALLTPAQRAVALTLLGYPDDSVGRLMTPHYVRAREHWTVREVLDHIRTHGQDSETLNVVYVIDEQGVLIDDIRIRELLLASPESRVTELMDRHFVALKATDDQQAAVAMFRQYDRTALPVTDTAGMLIGIVTIDDVLDVAESEATEDIQRIGGSEALDEPYMRTAFGSMVRKRAGWLTALFLGEMLTATAMGVFEAEIARAVVLALFVPLIISSGGNSGSQAATLVIRALALGEVGLADWWKVVRREIFAGLALGSILGGIGFLRISIWSAFSSIYGPHWLLVALTVSTALVGIVLWGTLIGSLLPLLMRRLGFDPATSSAPFVATLVDVTGLVIYFSVAIVILRGTLL
jgi:magnesium transporter